MAYRFFFLLLNIVLLLSRTNVFAGKRPFIQYDRSNGFPGNFGYYLFPDSRGYLWICTENGLARFNGYEFKIFTTKDGLPDNEIFGMAEDKAGRIWLCPFANSLCYIQGDKIFNRTNTPLLDRLHFNAWPSRLVFDDKGNCIVGEENLVMSISGKGVVKKHFFIRQRNSSVFFIKDRGVITAIFCTDSLSQGYRDEVYFFTGDRFEKANQLTFYRKKNNYLLYVSILSMLGIDRGRHFYNKAVLSGNPFYNDINETSKVVGVDTLPGGRVMWMRQDGGFVIDSATMQITDTFLYGNKIGAVCVLPDSALWVASHGRGVYRFINSRIKSLTLPAVVPSVRYIRATATGMYGILEKDSIVFAGTGKNAPAVLKSVQPFHNPLSSHAIIYMNQNRQHEWIGLGSNLYQYTNTLTRTPVINLKIGSGKDVAEEDDDHLLIATGSRLLRVDRNNIFQHADTLLECRTTSVVKTAGTIYAGTLSGLLAGTGAGNFRRIFAGAPSLNAHIVKLGNGHGNDVWVANNNAVLSVINGSRLLAVIGEKEGLQCSSIYALKKSAQFMWAGTDNGLYAIQNRPPFKVVRHLSQATGLTSNQVNCIDVYEGRVWVGTDHGINYFDEEEVFLKQPLPTMLINSIINGTDDIKPSVKAMTLEQKTLAVDFDVIDHAGGQKPKFQYRLNNDNNWVTIENSELYFPSVPYGSFTIHLQASSPNWEKPLGMTLLFYKAYPFYLRWWFLVFALLVFAGTVTMGIVLFIWRVRRKDQEKLSMQRNLLQLEQMALQGQMNPHFIFNCIAAIKQYYSLGDMQKANSFVDAFASLIRQTFEMGTETFVSLDRELAYLEKYLSIEQARFDHSFDFTISKDLELAETEIPVPAMLLQPLVENAVRHGVRHLSGRRGVIEIAAIQYDDRVTISITDNGVGREKSRHFGQLFRDITQLTSTTVNTKRIDILNRLFDQQIVHIAEDITNGHNETSGTRVTISYPLNIKNIHS